MKVLHIKLHEQTSSRKGADTCGHKDNQMDARKKTKIIGASRDGTNALKIEKKKIIIILHADCVT